MTVGPDSPAPPAASDTTPWQPAGFWRRYLAWSIDLLLLSPLLLVLLASPLRRALAAWNALLAGMQQWLLGRMLGADGALADAVPDPLALARDLLADPQDSAQFGGQITQMASAILQGCLLVAGVLALYFIAFEASRWQATPGKRWLGLRVQTMQGQPLGPASVMLRFFAGSLSWLSLNLGHALAAWRRDGRALHDLIAGAQVVTRTPMPTWARALLWAQVVALGLLFAGLALRLFWLLGQLATL